MSAVCKNCQSKKTIKYGKLGGIQLYYVWLKEKRLWRSGKQKLDVMHS
jgi:hypothetical protein